MSVYAYDIVSALQEWLNNHWNNSISQEEGELLFESFDKALTEYGKCCNAGVYACMQDTLKRIYGILKEDNGLSLLVKRLPEMIDHLNGVLEETFGDHAYKIMIPEKDSFVRLFEDVNDSRIMRNKVSGLNATELRDMIDEFIIRCADLPVIIYDDMERCMMPVRHFSLKSSELDGKDCATIEILGYREK